MAIDVRRLQEKRTQKLNEMEQLVAKAESEDRDLNEQERKLYDELQTAVRDLDGRIERANETNRRQAEQEQPAEQPVHRRQQPGDGELSASVGMSRDEVQRYSLVRAIRAAFTGDWSSAGLEREASRAEAKRRGQDPQSFYMPYDVMVGERRDLVVGTPTAGGNLVATDLMSGSFIEMLRNRMVVQAAGAMVMTGLVGDVAIPRQTGGATAYWVGEGGAPTESQQAVDQVALSPETVGAFTDYSRKLIMQSSLSVEQFVRTDLANSIALAIDYAALHGSGESNEPEGIENTDGIGSVVGGATGAAPDWADIVGLETAVAASNADIGRMAYITNAKVRGKLKVTQLASGLSFIWGNNDTPLNGYRALVTNQVKSTIAKGGSGSVLSAIFFGNWADLILAFWSGLDILVDPYTHSTSGTMRVVALQDVDVAVRHVESFSAMLDAVTT